MSGALSGEYCRPSYRFEPMVNLFHLSLASLTNQDGSEDKPSLVYNPAHNVLSFTHDVNRNPMSEHAVVRIFSFLLARLLRLITIPAVHLPFRLDVSHMQHLWSPYFLDMNSLFPGQLVFTTSPQLGP